MKKPNITPPAQRKRKRKLEVPPAPQVADPGPVFSVAPSSFDKERLKYLIGKLVAEIKQSDTTGERNNIRRNIKEIVPKMEETVDSGMTEFKNHPKALAEFLTCNTGVWPFTPLLLVLLRYKEALKLTSKIVEQMLKEEIRLIPPVAADLKSALYYLSGMVENLETKNVKSRLPGLLDKLTSWGYEDPKIAVNLYEGPNRAVGRLNSNDFTKYLLENFLEKLHEVSDYPVLLTEVRDRVFQKTTFEERFEYIKTFFRVKLFSINNRDGRLFFLQKNNLFETLKNIRGENIFCLYYQLEGILTKINDKHLDIIQFLFSTIHENRNLFLNFLTSPFTDKIKENKVEKTVKSNEINYGTILFILLMLWSRTGSYKKTRSLIKETIQYVDFFAKCYKTGIDYSRTKVEYCSILHYLRSNPLGMAIFFDIMSEEDPLQAQIFLTEPGCQNLSLLDWAIQSHATLSKRLIGMEEEKISTETKKDQPLLKNFQTGFELMVLFGEQAFIQVEKAFLECTTLPDVLMTLVLSYFLPVPDFKKIKKEMAEAKRSDLVNPMALFGAPLGLAAAGEIVVDGALLDIPMPQIG